MSKKSKVNPEQIRDLINEGKTTYQIAEILGCNQSHVSRTIKKYNTTNPNNPIKVLSKSEAQEKYIAEHGHQRIGTAHSNVSKNAISDKMRAFYESEEGQEAKEIISETRKKEWASMSEDAKRETLNNLKVANRESLKLGKGSKFENFLAEELKLAGFGVEQRCTRFAGGQLEVDIALANENIAIEVDGPTHWSDIYGAQKLAEVQTKDRLKDNQLLTVGWNVLRLQDKSGVCSKARINRILDKIKEIKSSKQPQVYVVKL